MLLVGAVSLGGAFVSSYGVPWHWKDPGGGTPWASAAGSVGTLIGMAVLGRVITRSRLAVPGPSRDLAVSAGAGDVVRVGRNPAGRVLDKASRPAGRALLVLNTRRMVANVVLLVVGVAGTVLVQTVPTPSTSSRWPLLMTGVVAVVASLEGLGWSLLMRRHGSAEGLVGDSDPTA